MARPKRIDLPHCLYHVLSRTNSGDLAFRDCGDRRKFFHYLAKYTRQFSFRILSFCLMPNHFHLLLESGECAGLSEFMRRLLTAYTVYYNQRYERHGHLFQGRFKSYVVDKAEYLLSLSRYIHLNPFRGLPAGASESYDGSSLMYYIKGGEPAFLDTSEILAWFKNDRAKYAKYVREGLNEDVHLPILEQRYVGGAAFAGRLRKRMDLQKQMGRRGQISQEKRKRAPIDAGAKQADEIANLVAAHFHLTVGQIKIRKAAHGLVGQARTAMIAILAETLPWTYARIARYVDLTEPSIVSYHLRRIVQNKELQKHLGEIRRCISKLNLKRL